MAFVSGHPSCAEPHLRSQLFEKYDGVERNERVRLRYGYPSNEVGFGWTNAVFTRLVRGARRSGS